MANKLYTPATSVLSTDYHAVKFEGFTKDNKKITISMPKAINMGNVDLAFAEKADTVAALTFTGVYANTDDMNAGAAPYTITVQDGVTAGAKEIVLGAGYVYIDNTQVALTRGGSKFTSTREFRKINADGDRGAVEGRIVLDAEEPTLTLNALTWLTKLDTMYPAFTQTTTT